MSNFQSRVGSAVTALGNALAKGPQRAAVTAVEHGDTVWVATLADVADTRTRVFTDERAAHQWIVDVAKSDWDVNSWGCIPIYWDDQEIVDAYLEQTSDKFTVVEAEFVQ